MKIPASKVPAQVWADRARAHYGSLKKMEKDVLGYWEENKQVYRMNDALWDEMSIDEAEEFPMSLLDRLPYDCVFIQHRETIEIPFVFRGHELSGTVEREGYFCFRDAEGFHIAALNGQVDFMMGMDNTIAPIPITLEDYKSIGDCKDAAAIGTLAIAEEAKIEMAVETGIVAKDDSLEMASRLQMEAAGVSDMEKILGTLMYISSKEGEYEVSFISPVDKDGSIYEVPKTAKVKSEAEDKDGKDTGDELPFEFKPIAADKTDADALNAIVKSVGDAVKKGDETLTGANGTKVIELVKENAKANPNADKEKVEEESQKAEDSNKDNGETKPGNAGGDGNNNAGGESGANGQNQGGDGGGSSNSGNSSNDGGSQHVHNWVTQTIHHNAQYQTIHHEAVYDYRSICNGCGADITGNVDAHMQDALLNGNTACGAYHTENVLVSQAWDETVEISPAWDEIVYICSSCGAPM